MHIKVVTINLLMSQAYLVTVNELTVLIDCGMPGEDSKILRNMKSVGIHKIDMIFLTHAHIDHSGSASATRKATGAPIAIHLEDSEALAAGETRLGTAKGRGRVTAALMPLIQRVWKSPETQADILLDDGQDLSEYGIEARVLHTPGHTFGSSCLLAENLAFVGDLLTSTGGKARLQRFYAESWSLLQPSLVSLVEAAPRLCFPGHGDKPIPINELQYLVGE